MIGARLLPGALVAIVFTACARSGAPTTPPATSSPNPTVTPSATANPSPTPLPPAPDILARHLLIPSLGINAEVQVSEVVAVTPNGGSGGDITLPGCRSAPLTGPSPQTGPPPQANPSPEAGPPPSPQDGATTFTVPREGIATPKDAFDYLQHRSWIFGHSRWQGVPGLFFALQRIERGDELFVDGVDRLTEEPIDGARFVVTGIYLADVRAGGALVAGDRIGAPGTPLVILQTSVRESGANRPWILNRATVLDKAENIVDGDLDDPCKYLLLFVVAEHAP